MIIFMVILFFQLSYNSMIAQTYPEKVKLTITPNFTKNEDSCTKEKEKKVYYKYFAQTAGNNASCPAVLTVTLSYYSEERPKVGNTTTTCKNFQEQLMECCDEEVNKISNKNGESPEVAVAKRGDRFNDCRDNTSGTFKNKCERERSGFIASCGNKVTVYEQRMNPWECYKNDGSGDFIRDNWVKTITTKNSDKDNIMQIDIYCIYKGQMENPCTKNIDPQTKFLTDPKTQVYWVNPLKFRVEDSNVSCTKESIAKIIKTEKEAEIEKQRQKEEREELARQKQREREELARQKAEREESLRQAQADKEDAARQAQEARNKPSSPSVNCQCIISDPQKSSCALTLKVGVRNPNAGITLSNNVNVSKSYCENFCLFNGGGAGGYRADSGKICTCESRSVVE